MAYVKKVFKDEGAATANDPRIDAKFLNELQDTVIATEIKSITNETNIKKIEKARVLVDSGKQTFSTGTLYWYKYEDGELEMYGFFSGYTLDANGKAVISLPVSFVGYYNPIVSASYNSTQYATNVTAQEPNKLSIYFSIVDGTPRPMANLDQSFGLLLKGRFK